MDHIVNGVAKSQTQLSDFHFHPGRVSDGTCVSSALGFSRIPLSARLPAAPLDRKLCLAWVAPSTEQGTRLLFRWSEASVSRIAKEK